MANTIIEEKKYSTPTRIFCGLLGMAFFLGALIELYQAVIHGNYEFWLLMIVLPYMAFIFLYSAFFAKNPFELLNTKPLNKE
ncbi:hypothetical protein [Marinicella sp. W31]|uniref:hypothetical protein n=1 Tax=Marinicella sp. W31 TaxID=3023713 RepID=UPI003757A41F